MRFAISSYLVIAAALAASALAQVAQVVPTDADRAFAEELVSLSAQEAHAAIALAERDRITAGLAKALNEAGVRAFTQQHDTRASLGLYSLAIDAAERGGFTLIEADGRANSCISLTRAGDLDGALRQVNRALGLYRGANGAALKIANALSIRSVAYKELGELSTALDDNRAAQLMFREVGEELGLARALNNGALLSLLTGDYRHALETLKRSLDIAERHNEKIGQAFVLNNFADVYISEGNYGLAVSYAERSLKLKETAGSREDLPSSLVNLATVYHQDNRDAAAIEALQRAVQIAREVGRKTNEAEALSLLGVVELDRKQYGEALEHLKASLQLYREAGSTLLEARTLGRIAQVYAARLEFAKAAETADRARELSRVVGATPELFLPSLIAGRAYLALGKNADARKAWEDAVAVVESGRERVAGDELSRQKFLGGRIAPYRELIALDVREGKREAALHMAERAKGRVLLELLTSEKTGGDRVLTAAERTTEAELHRKLAIARAQLAALSVGTSGRAPEKQRVQEANGRIEKARAELANFRSILYATHPELGARRGDAAPVTLAQTADMLPDANTAILEFTVTSGPIYLFTIVKGPSGPMMRVHSIPLTQTQLRHDAGEFRDKLASRDPDFAGVADRLYQVLLGRAQEELAGKKRWIVVPDSSLWQIPFQALRSPAGRYVIEDAAVFYTPSLSVLHSLHQARLAKRGPDQHAATLAAFGNPGSDNANEEREVKALAELYGAAASRTWMGSQASGEAFRSRAGTYDVIHVAAHGVFDDRDPLQSHIILRETGGKADGEVEAGEIQDLELKARLVVLSGCETARGRFADGEGAIGMSWAFLAAGGRAVVASQWRVESSSTTELMLQFHKRLLSGEGNTQSLRQAALALMRSERFRHPFYWAGFALFGEGE